MTKHISPLILFIVDRVQLFPGCAPFESFHVVFQSLLLVGASGVKVAHILVQSVTSVSLKISQIGHSHDLVVSRANRRSEGGGAAFYFDCLVLRPPTAVWERDY